MKLSLAIAICAASITVATAQVDSSQAFYEKMAVNTFAIISDIGHTDLSSSTVESFFYNGATSAFCYWINTRKGKISPSKDVDAAIAMFYEEAKKRNLISVFSDPLLRKSDPEPERHGVRGFSKMTQKQYEQYVVEFQSYLHDVFQARMNRFKKNQTEQDAAANP